MKKTIIIIAIIVVVVILAFTALRKQATAPVVETPLGEDTTAAIEQGLEAVDLGDLDAEFQAIDQDLNSL